MGKSSPNTTEAPDPVAVAAAQGTSNVETAVAQARLNAVDQYNPSGSTVFSVVDEVDGVPKYRVDTNLSPAQQAIFDQSNETSLGLGRLASTGVSNAQDVLGSAVDLSDDSIVKNLRDSYNSVYGDQWNTRRGDLESNLVNRGIRPGSDAYDKTVRGFEQSRNDAENQLLLNGRTQALSQMLAQRNQPINEITALASGSQVSNPAASQVQVPQTGIAPTDVIGATYGAYNSGLSANRQAGAAGQQAVGGLFALGAGALQGGYF